MNRNPLLLVLACCVISHGIDASEDLGAGKLLVATELIQGQAFAESVVLILNHDTSGAAGLVVNRPTEVPPVEALPALDGVEQYEGTLYWGGPVAQFTLRALLQSETPPDGAVPVFDSVFLAVLDEKMLDGFSSTANLRFFLGYAGWAPGQLEQEMESGSWHVIAATEALVFSDDPDGLWRTLLPPPTRRVSLDRPGMLLSGSR